MDLNTVDSVNNIFQYEIYVHGYNQITSSPFNGTQTELSFPSFFQVHEDEFLQHA